MNIGKYILPLIGVASVALMQGCVSSGNTRGVYDPAGRLDHLLESYAVNSEQGIACHSVRSAPLDCDSLSNELEALTLEFPGDARILLTSAMVDYQMESYVESQFTLDQLLALPGAHPEAAILRSRIALADGNFALARTVLERQIRYVPDYPALYESRAASYYMEGRYDKALIAVKAADRLGAPAWRTDYHLGLIAQAREEWARACTYFVDVLALKPNHHQSISRLLLLSEYEDCKAPSSARVTRRLR